MNKKKKFDWYGVIRVLTSILIALIIAAIIIFAVADDPLTALNKFLLGPFSTKRNFFNAVETMIPLVFCGLAINVMHKSGLFSMAADSSFYFSGVVAAMLAIACPLPAGVHQIVILAAATVVGGAIGVIPVIIKKKTGANELVISLMMNYIFFNFGYWLIRAFFLDEANGSFSIGFQKTATLGKLIKGTSTHYGIFIMIAAVVVMWLLMDKSKFGRELQITGSNASFARYSGLKIGGIILGSQLIGGMLAGLGGGVQMIGMYTHFQWITAQTYVWDGILINLLAGTRPLMIPVSAFFISYIRSGALVMSRGGDVDSEIVSIIQGIIIMLIASERFMYRMKKRKEEREALQNQAVDTEAAGAN